MDESVDVDESVVVELEAASSVVLSSVVVVSLV